MRYKISQFARKHNVTTRTVWNWIKDNKISTERTSSGGWLVVEEQPIKKEKVAIYARVSSSENKSNLDSQKERLLNYCSAKGYQVEIISCEIGSGLNDQRRKAYLKSKNSLLFLKEIKEYILKFDLYIDFVFNESFGYDLENKITIKPFLVTDDRFEEGLKDGRYVYKEVSDIKIFDEEDLFLFFGKNKGKTIYFLRNGLSIFWEDSGDIIIKVYVDSNKRKLENQEISELKDVPL